MKNTNLVSPRKQYVCGKMEVNEQHKSSESHKQYVCGKVEALCLLISGMYEPRRKKSGLLGFRTGPTQTGLKKVRGMKYWTLDL